MRWPEIEKAVERLNRHMLAVSALLLAAMAGIVILNVLTRYALQVSMTWSAELARYCMVWSAMLASAVLVARGQHLVVDVLSSRLPPMLDHVMRLLVGTLSIAFYAALFISGVFLVLRTRGQVASSIELLPMSAVYAVVPLAALLMLVGTVAALFQTSEDEDRKQ